jgi:hypothetical protein
MITQQICHNRWESSAWRLKLHHRKKNKCPKGHHDWGPHDVKTEAQDGDEGGVTVCGGESTWVSRGKDEGYVRTARAYLRTVMRCAKDECSKHMDQTNIIRFVSAVLKCMQLPLSLCV